MVELAGLSLEVINHIPQAAAAGQLCCEQGDKLVPTRKRLELLTDMVLAGKRLKFISRKNTYNLRKNGATMGHGLELLVFIVVLANAL